MGFSTSAAAAVLFIGVLVSVSMVYPALTDNVESVSEAMNEREDRTLDQRNAGIEVENATYHNSSDEVTINVTNTGTTALTANETDVLLDGRLQPDPTREIDGATNREVWAPGETMQLTVTGVTTAPTRVVVVAEFGISAANSSITDTGA